MTQPAEATTPPEQADAGASTSGQAAEGRGKECPICVMFKEGGCETEFNNFMDCGVNAEKGDANFQDCIALFDSMRKCMQSNPAVFGEVLKDVDELAKTNTPYPPEQQPAAGAGKS